LEWKGHRVFQVVWWISNLLLLASLLIAAYAIGWEYSVRSYLDGFSDAIVPETATPEQTVQYILDWMRTGPRAVAQDPNALARRDPEDTLNYKQLLDVCGTATNAFLNLARSSNLQTRRLLLLTPERNTKHVVAEVLLDNRWVIVDPTYRVILRDAQGRMLTRKDLQDPAIFAEATGKIPGYPPEYNYQTFAHVRLARLPLQRLHLRRVLDFIYPGWDESTDWSLLLERRSFFVLFVALLATLFFAVLRFGLGWYADHRLGLPRIRLRQKALRAGAAFFTTPEIK
jgi:hypothetical protein